MGYNIYLTIWLMGLISGVSVMLTGSTLNFWLAQSKVNITEIGFFALVALPYSINFIWSPILDTIKVPGLTKLVGQRLAWIVLLQSMLSLTLWFLSCFKPSEDIIFIAMLAIFIALISSTNDNLLNALRIEILDEKDYGQSAGSYVVGYRIGMMIATAGVIYLTKYITWQTIYQIIAITFVFFSVLLIILLDPRGLQERSDKKTKITNFNFQAVIEHMQPIKMVVYILIFLVLYRIADYFIATMINPFVLDLNFTTEQIAAVGKFSASIGVIVGGILGGYLMKRIQIIDALYYFGIIHTSAHLLLALQAIVGNNLWLYLLTSICESITGGMAMAAYIAFISAICYGPYKATQQGLFSSMMGISRSIFPSISGIVAANFGWLNFFLITFFLSLPSLLMLRIMKNNFSQYVAKK